jgi:murein DD-endopeptidase MepM/ murein hydrolase activator NlpD
MALLAEASADGTPHRSDILSVVGPFPVAGLTWWTNDWHAYRCCPYPHLHQGLDMFASIGTPVVAAADGTVSQRVNDAISGLGVEITDAANTQYFYAHLSGFAAGLHVGQHVRLGEIVGYVGNSGNAARTSPHLHFEVQPGGVPVPPKPFVDRWLTMAEAKAEALVRERAGDAAPSASDLARWNALAQALRPPLGMEAGVEGTGIQSGVLTSADPPAPSAGWVVALASGMLLLVLVVPGCFMGRRDARPGGNPP